jgi:transcriptional regulator GlxA family with amidase domain
MLLNSNNTACAEQSGLPERLVSSTNEAATPSVAQLRARIRGGLPPRALRRVREFIEAHLEQNISIHALATIAGLSMYHFARAFKQSEGMTPHDYLVQCRVRRAQDLLAATDLPLSEIALASGFADQSHCARRFREHVGVTPSSYRWSMR